MYTLDTESNQNYYILKKDNIEVCKFNKDRNTVESVKATLKQLGVEL